MDELKTIKLMIGTDRQGAAFIKQKSFKLLTFASNNLETVAHYYEGYVIELEVNIDPALRMKYIRGEPEMPDGYTFGSAEMRCPAEATWYSFSKDYLTFLSYCI